MLGWGLCTATPMVLGMGIALTVAGIAAPDAAAYFTRTSQHHDGVQSDQILKIGRLELFKFLL